MSDVRGAPRRLAGLALLLCTLLAVVAACGSGEAAPGTRRTVDLSGDDWTLTLDLDARWAEDGLHLPGVDVASLPVHPPTGGWDSLARDGRPVSVPGTVEGVMWEELGGDYVGVSWWSRPLERPEPLGGRRAVLRFSSVRLRAEVFVDGALVGYDAVGHTPFEVDVTDALAEDGPHTLAVRVTDPSGNFDWRDYDAHRWGEQTIPASHGFGGLLGPVTLELRDPLHVADVFVANRADPDVVDVHVELGGATAGGTAPPLEVTLALEEAPGEPVARAVVPAAPLTEGPAGPVATVLLDVAGLPRWSPEDPRLLRCRVSLLEVPAGTELAEESFALGMPLPAGVTRSDSLEVRCGLRWFAPDGVGSDAVLRLDGRRVVLRSAISWGFWPVTGAVPTPELARRQVEVARELGLNMLNHHRNLAAPGVLDWHDELGLLAYLEPGGYWAQGGDELCHAFAREKWLRMVRRDRNHPSVVIYNMINESKDAPVGRFRRDLLDAQRLDPTRIITYTSGWSEDDGHDLHARPGETELFTDGWWDQHNAPGPGVDRDGHWNGPDDHLRRSERREDVVFWGEDGAIATPHRLALDVAELEGGPPGWDGELTRARHDALDRWLDAHGWRDAIPDVDTLTRSLGDVSFRYQAGVIENIRLGDVADGYVVNGWEDSKLENHSGIVDAWRFPKGDPQILARANAPRLLAVKLRRRIAHVGRDHGAGVRSPAVVIADVSLIDEAPEPGRRELLLEVVDAAGEVVRSAVRPVRVRGGDRFGQLLLEELRVLVEGGPGAYQVRAALLPERTGEGAGAREVDGPWAEAIARGAQDVYLVDWQGREVPPGGALVNENGQVGQFLNTTRGAGVPRFEAALPPLEWVVVSDSDPEPLTEVPAEAFLDPDGRAGGLRGEYFDDRDFDPARLVATRFDEGLAFRFADEGPLPELDAHTYTVRWTGALRAQEPGPHRLVVEASGGVRLWIDDVLVVDDWREHGPELLAAPVVELDPARPASLRLDYLQDGDNSRVILKWCPPEASARGRELVTELSRRVAEDGTTLLVLDRADVWSRLLAEAGALRTEGVLTLGRYWMGGNFFVRSHPLFAGLPVDGALDWPYQELVHYGMRPYGLRLPDAEVVVGCLADHRPEPAVAVGVVEHGAGRLVLSTLDIPRALLGPPGPRDLVKALLMNALEYGAGH